MSYTAHVDTFVRDNLPPRSEWPEFVFELPELKSPGRLNGATGLLDKPVTRGYGHRIALRSPDGECTYTQLFTQTNRLANVLVREMNLKPGNRVLLRGANNPMMAAAWLAVMKAGGVCVATMPLLRAKELTDIITKAEITHALCDKRLETELEAAAPNCPTLREIRYWYDDSANSLDNLALRQPLTFGNVPTAADDPALIAFTSGTTGKPKGTVHFHRDVIAMCDCFPRSIMKMAKDDVVCGTPPIAFTFGLGGMLCFPLRYGASTVLVEKHTPETLLETIERFKANTCFTTPIMYRQMAAMAKEFDLRSLKNCVSAGEALPDPTRQAFKGPTGCRYLADERQRNYVQHGWNVTGDAYLMDEDGYFFYQARTDDMIISAGYNIAGPEVETALLAHPAVAECGVVGWPDEERGTIVKAFVVLKEGNARDAAMVSALQDHVKKAIAPYKYPRAIEFVDTLPRTETGKLQRFKLRKAP